MADDTLMSGDAMDADGDASVEVEVVGLDPGGVARFEDPAALLAIALSSEMVSLTPAVAAASAFAVGSPSPALSPGAASEPSCAPSNAEPACPTSWRAGSTAKDTLLLFFLRAMLAECEDASLAFRLRACPSLLSVSRKELFK